MIRNLKFLTIMLLALTVNRANATHILQLDANVSCVAKSSSQIELQLNLIQMRDAAVSSVPFDTKLDVGIYDRTTRKLIQIFTISIINEALYAPSLPGYNLYTSELEGNVKVPISQNGYIIFFGRCCMRPSQNFAEDVGTGVVIEVPSSIQAGQHTLKRDNFGFFFGQRNKAKNFGYPWESSLFDSIHFESYNYYLYGNKSEPIAEIPGSFSDLPIGTFKNSGKPGQPFGKNGTLTVLNDSVYSIEIAQNGLYFYPITSTTYLNGDSTKTTQVLSIFIQDSIPPIFDLSLNSYKNGIAHFYGYSQGWPNSATIYFQRSEDKLPYAFSTLTSITNDGYALPFTDSSQEQSKRYAYRLHRAGNGSSVYSDTIVLQNNVGLSPGFGASLLTVFPNPATRIITIRGNFFGPYYLHDLQGKIQLQGTKSEETETISINELEQGIYFLKIAGKAYRVIKSN